MKNFLSNLLSEKQPVAPLTSPPTRETEDQAEKRRANEFAAKLSRLKTGMKRQELIDLFNSPEFKTRRSWEKQEIWFFRSELGEFQTTMRDGRVGNISILYVAPRVKKLLTLSEDTAKPLSTRKANRFQPPLDQEIKTKVLDAVLLQGKRIDLFEGNKHGEVHLTPDVVKRSEYTYGDRDQSDYIEFVVGLDSVRADFLHSLVGNDISYGRLYFPDICYGCNKLANGYHVFEVSYQYRALSRNLHFSGGDEGRIRHALSCRRYWYLVPVCDPSEHSKDKQSLRLLEDSHKLVIRIGKKNMEYAERFAECNGLSQFLRQE